ncbi:adenylate kinase 8 isoform X1 [Sus scrofa]|uniref:adenylate kinase 8 isoform X1 n=1 Tax=Sus scrofa TaxID=9823 RepID=UPI000A2B32EB|nr:adenylate kinase 8 isoform X1 [Sus scrofa]XP_020926485.1 adenylate kinase 8 isoform X1 [Sus scrofa]
MWLCKHLRSNLLSVENLIARQFSSLAAGARQHYQKFKTLPSGLLVRLVQARLREEDCVTRGWILDGIPETREQALLLQTLGIAPRHVIVLSAPDTVLIERNLGKRVDPLTGEVYHTTFDWPPQPEIQNRLLVPAGISEGETARKLLEFHRNIVRIAPSYPKILRVIPADQPCVDVFCQALTYVQTIHRSNAPFTPRVLLLGPMGSGKSLQAALLAQKYGLVNVCCGQLLKEAVADKSKYGKVILSFFEKEIAVPDSIIMKVLGRRLDQQDCVERGWVLHGFPRDLDQAHMLNSLGYKPNRKEAEEPPRVSRTCSPAWRHHLTSWEPEVFILDVVRITAPYLDSMGQRTCVAVRLLCWVFFLNVPFDSILERLTLRRTDPVTGERYHLMYKPPPTVEIQARLLQNPKDTEEQVKLKMDLFCRTSAELEQFYQPVLPLNGDQDPYTVFEHLESGIINPLPNKVP